MHANHFTLILFCVERITKLLVRRFLIATDRRQWRDKNQVNDQTH